MASASPRASVIVLPCSATISRASASASARMPAAIARTTAPRCTPLRRAHSGCAERAASSARAASSSVPSGISAITDSSAGLRTGRVSWAVTHDPPISMAGLSIDPPKSQPARLRARYVWMVTTTIRNSPLTICCT